jgi:peptide deformylase
MAILPIVTLPDPVLRQTSTDVGAIDADVKRLAADMLETMYDAPGIGLAAIQVGVPTRLVVLDVSDKDDEKQPIVLVNPRILTLSEEMRSYEEGCLSLPDVKVEIERPSTLRLAYQDLEGKALEIDADGLLATAIQHELDHLDGKLIIDFMSKLRRDMVIKRFKKKARVG